MPLLLVYSNLSGIFSRTNIWINKALEKTLKAIFSGLV